MSLLDDTEEVKNSEEEKTEENVEPEVVDNEGEDKNGNEVEELKDQLNELAEEVSSLKKLNDFELNALNSNREVIRKFGDKADIGLDELGGMEEIEERRKEEELIDDDAFDIIPNLRDMIESGKLTKLEGAQVSEALLKGEVSEEDKEELKEV